MKERKDRVDDAMHATRAAVEEGIVPGGGTALVKSIGNLENVKGDNDDQNVGINIVRRAIRHQHVRFLTTPVQMVLLLLASFSKKLQTLSVTTHRLVSLKT